MTTGESALSRLLTHAAHRVGVRSAVSTAAMGAAAAALCTASGLIVASLTDSDAHWLVRSPGGVLLTLGVGVFGGAAVGWWRSASLRRGIAGIVDAAVPAAQNLLVTAAELSASDDPTTDNRTRTTPAIRALIQQRADALAMSIDCAALFPWRPAGVRLAAGIAAWSVAAMLALGVPAGARTVPFSTVLATATGRVDIQRVTVRVTLPRYAQGRTASNIAADASTTLRDPARIEALAGSTIAFTVDASADTLLVVTRQSTQSLVRSANGTFMWSLPATADGFVSLEPHGAHGETGARRLIGMTVRTDEAPRVRIVAPARDLIVPDRNRTLDVRLEADDDLAVGSLRLHYTKVSGSGERFTFSEGDVPVSITRTAAAQWSARAALALAPLLAEPGDLVVYRAIATDSRPGSPAVESDAFIAELAAPGGMAALGFSLDPDEDRYAVSQQMVILKTERLLARRATMPASVLADSAAQIAGEQRRVRAEFVFMMGGEFAQEATGELGSTDLDETQEAESEGDLAAGRMGNRGRVALLSAVRAMSRAAVSLTVADVAAALPLEKTALTQLQEAFARSRFLMRALSQREQLDMSRRLTGRLDSTARGHAPVPAGEPDSTRDAWRALLGDVVRLASPSSFERSTFERSAIDRPAIDRPAIDRAQASLLAERVLRLDASSPAAQRVAAHLSAAGSAGASAPRVQALLDSAATAMTALLRARLRPSAPTTDTRDARRLQSALDAASGTSREAVRGATPNAVVRPRGNR